MAKDRIIEALGERQLVLRRQAERVSTEI